jgi:hypothetical protein
MNMDKDMGKKHGKITKGHETAKERSETSCLVDDFLEGCMMDG